MRFLRLMMNLLADDRKFSEDIQQQAGAERLQDDAGYFALA